ncbi:hypothetical protein MKW92_034744 [Papaver armeniacum]|nr:hypothetical protein MKW92_034744 [Papaver armeniacum]
MAKLFSVILGVFLLFIVSISASTNQENTRVSTFSESLCSCLSDNKCSIGESKFARRCKCCCRESPPPCPANTYPKEMSVVLKPGQKACKYIFVVIIIFISS